MNGRRLGAMFSDPGLIAQVMALRGYQVQPSSGRCLLVKSSGLASWERLLFRPWRRLFGPDLQEVVVEGLHGSIFDAAHVDRLARCLADALELRATEPSPVETLRAVRT